MLRRSWILNTRTKPRHGRLEGDDLAKLRIECFERDDYKCQECGCAVYPDYHHTHAHSAHMAHIRAKRIGLDTLNNVRTLCGHDHRIEHAYGKTMTKPCPAKPPKESDAHA